MSQTQDQQAGQSRAAVNKERPDPFAFRSGRRCLREAVKYPLPVDLAEMNRQILRTMLLIQVFGAPFCCKFAKPPRKILEIACGSGFWTSSCYEYFKAQGHNNISFTGLDLAPLPPDLSKQGIDWRFVQHDLRKPPMPFREGEFDFIFVNDGMVVFAADNNNFVNPLSILKKYLSPGGVVEIWEADFIFRCLLPEPLTAPGIAQEDIEQAKRSATYTISAATPFTKAQNKYLQDYNKWLEASFHKLGLGVQPCATLAYGASTEAEVPGNVGSRRIAIPFSPIHWEAAECPHKASGRALKSSCEQGGEQDKIISHDCGIARSLTPEQTAIRSTAMKVTIGFIESLEDVLKEESGMKQDEWFRWWSGMTTSLLEEDGTGHGECLEAGSWWVRK